MRIQEPPSHFFTCAPGHCGTGRVEHARWRYHHPKARTTCGKKTHTRWVLETEVLWKSSSLFILFPKEHVLQSDWLRVYIPTPILTVNRLLDIQQNIFFKNKHKEFILISIHPTCDIKLLRLFQINGTLNTIFAGMLKTIQKDQSVHRL